MCVYVCFQVCGNEVNTIELDSDVSLEIPSGTVIAYSIVELEIKKNGQYGKRVFEFVCVFLYYCMDCRRRSNSLKV